MSKPRSISFTQYIFPMTITYHKYIIKIEPSLPSHDPLYMRLPSTYDWDGSEVPSQTFIKFCFFSFHHKLGTWDTHVFFFRAVTTIYIYISAASRRSRACVLGLGLNWQHVLNFYVKKKGKRMFESRFQTKLTKAIGNMLQPLQRGKKLTIQKRN